VTFVLNREEAAMDAPDREQTLKKLLDAGTATRVEEVLDDAGIGLERSGIDPNQIEEFWLYLHDELAPAALKEKSFLAFSRLVGYARASINARAKR
jgi:hypothetical protein